MVFINFSWLSFLVLFGSLAAVRAQGSEANVYLTVSFCPTESQGMGAVVRVDPVSGAYKVMHTFEWPQAIFGCPLLYDPATTHSGKSTSDPAVVFDFTSSSGLMAEIGLVSGKVEFHTAPQDPFFSGYVNFEFTKGSFGTRGEALGLTPTVTQDGLCDDGCFGFGSLSVPAGKYARRAIVPFKAILDDAHFDDGKTYFVQGSYDLRPEGQRCGSGNATECLLRIDKVTGKLESTTPTPTWTAYKFSNEKNAAGNVTAWLNGFDSQCNDPYNDWAFGSLDLATAQGSLLACISHNVTVHMDEWIADFSPDHTMMATASGNSEAPAQLVVFHVPSATTMLQISLAKLAKELNAFEGLFDVWDVAFF